MGDKKYGLLLGLAEFKIQAHLMVAVLAAMDM